MYRGSHHCKLQGNILLKLENTECKFDSLVEWSHVGLSVPETDLFSEVCVELQ